MPVRPREEGEALHAFDGGSYGAGYLTLKQHDRVVRDAVEGGWSYGERVSDGAAGWFPTSYWAASAGLSGGAEAGQGGSGAAGPSAGSSRPRECRSTEESPSQGVGAAWLAASPEADAGAAAGATPSHPSQVPVVTGAEWFGDPEAGHQYSRERLLVVMALARPDPLPEGTSLPRVEPAPADGAVTRLPAKDGARATPEVLAQLLELAGGTLRVGNLAAATIALNIASGSHQQVYQNIVAAARGSPDLFEPPPVQLKMAELSKCLLVLRRK